MTDMERAICSTLNLYIFQNVWNEPVSEYRANIHPIMLSSRSRTGYFIFAEQQITLPTQDPCYLYLMKLDNFSGILDLRSSDWVDGATLCNKYKILLHTYDVQGRILPKCQVWLKVNHITSNVIMAVNKKAAMQLNLKHEDMSQIWVTPYFDSDIVNDTVVHSKLVPMRDASYTVRYPLFQAIQKAGKKATVFINGNEAVVTAVSQMKEGDYVDVVIDENIVATFDVDLGDTKQNFQFFSTIDKLHKYIVHMPKVLNPHQDVYTHNTMDIFIRKPNSVHNSLGRYLHRIQDRSVTQITHQDIAIPDFIIDAYRDYLDTQDVQIHVVVRKHDKDNVLVRDASYIDLLYTHDDEDIKYFLAGKKLTGFDLKFWHAEYLEQTRYIEFFFDSPDEAQIENMKLYMEALGYYHVLAIICNRVAITKVTDLFKGSMTFPKPVVYANANVFPVVYLNKIKVPFDKITFKNDPNFVSIQIDNTIGWKIGDEIVVEIFLTGSNRVYRVKPTDTNSTFEIPGYRNPVIFEETDISPRKTSGVNTVYTDSYEKITDYIGKIVVSDTAIGSKIRFGGACYDKTYVIQNPITVYTQKHDIDNRILFGEPIVIDLVSSTISDPKNTPILDLPGMIVFMNGKHLHRGIDYEIQEIRDYSSRLAMKQLVIQNMSYLKDSGNHVEFIINSAEIEDDNHGFMVDQRIYGDSLNLWFEKLSMVHIDGSLETDVLQLGDYLFVNNDTYRQGSPFEVRTSIPRIVKNFLDRFDTNSDKDRLALLNEYFNGKAKEFKQPIFITHSHRVYSVYTAQIIRDIIRNVLVVAHDPDANRMLSQLKAYEHIKQYDLGYRDDFNFHFSDLFPTYRNYTDVPVDKYRIIHELVDLLLPKDPITGGDAPYVHPHTGT